VADYFSWMIHSRAPVTRVVLPIDWDEAQPLNPYSSPSQANTSSGSIAQRGLGPSLLYSIQTVWIATGISLLALAMVASLMWDESGLRLLSSDDSYVASFAASAPVAVIFAIGCTAGWWFQSSRIALVATAVPIVCFATLLWVSDYVHDFGEGDEIFGYLGLGIFLGGTFGFLAFLIRNTFARLVLSIAPQFLFGIGYAIALHAMSK